MIAIDSQGNALPWFTYSSISFLKPKLSRNFSIFEYGSGQSTLWWSRQVASVNSCEHDPSWYKRLGKVIPANVKLLSRGESDSRAYVESILETDQKFDIVVVDGLFRNDCVEPSLRALKPNGVIIWDNSDLEDYAKGLAALQARGFKRIDFEGMGPVNDYSWTTSILYREDNCLGI